MSLFSSPHDYSDMFMEAYITNVDPIRYLCSAKTVKGQYFNELSWLHMVGGSGKNGSHAAPSTGDQVLIFTGLGYPLIMGAIPRLGVPSTDLTNATGQPLAIDAGNNSNLKNGYVTNPDKPSDFMPGDQFWTSEGGGILALLSNGTFMAKASALAQIIVTKYDDLVRIVARNFERFSDVGQQTVANVKGRMYEYLGWDRDLGRSKVGLYELQDVVGDVVAGETLKGEPNASTTLPAPDTRVRKYWLTDTAGNVRMVELLYQDGKLDLLVRDAPGTTNTREIQQTDKYEVTNTTAAGYSRITVDGTKIFLDRNGASTAVVDDNQVQLVHGGATHTVDSNGVRSEFGGHFCRVTSSGVALG